MRFCKDCKWSSGRDPVFRMCDYPHIKKRINLVTGKCEPKLPFATFQRYDDWFMCRILGTCGKEGRWFEPLEEEP